LILTLSSLSGADSAVSFASKSNFVALDLDGADMDVNLSGFKVLKDEVEEKEKQELSLSWSGMLKSMAVHLLNSF